MGDEIKCRVLRVEARRIELTSKKSLVEASRVLTSYDDASENCGKSFAGFVTGADAARGLVVTFFGNVQGRVDPASLRARGIVDPSQSFALGTVVTCCVKGVTTPKTRQDGTSRKPRIALTLDDVDGCKVEVDSVLKAVAVELVEARAKGASKRAPRKAVACLCRVTSSKGECLAKLPVAHACDHGLEAESTLRRLASTGAPFACRVLEGSSDGAPAKISAAPSMINATTGKLELDAIRTGVVVQLKPYGAFVSFGGQDRGLIPRALVADRYIGDLEDCFRLEILYDVPSIPSKVIGWCCGREVSRATRRAPSDVQYCGAYPVTIRCAWALRMTLSSLRMTTASASPRSTVSNVEASRP